MQEVTTTYNTNTITLVSNLSYNPFSGPKGMDNGAGGSISKVSEECDCLTISNPGEPMEKTFTYDLNGNLETVRGTNAIWYNKDYAYDELNRIIQADDYNGTISYTYDNVGNRLTRNVGPYTQEYFYNSGTNQLNRTEDLNPVRFTYDANGNAVSMGLKSLIYNQNNRLVRIEDGVDTIAEYTYNALGQRTTKQVGGVTTVYLYDFDGKIIGESLPDGSFDYEYLYLWSNRMAMVDFSDGSLYYYQNDHLGTPILIKDSDNTIVWEANYKPFGEAEVDPASTIDNNFRFAGQYFDAETGLHYNYHRYYDPSIGRYLRPDPIGLKGGINLFVYVSNNPINLVDQFGLYESPWWLMWVPGQYSWDRSMSAFEQGKYGWGTAYIGAMLGEQVLFALTLGEYGLTRIGGQCTSTVSSSQSVSNPIPKTVARVIPGKGPFPTLGRPGTSDVYVTAADDIAGLNAAQISKKLSIPKSDSYTIVKFRTPKSGLASPINRTDPGFIGGGRTAGGAREFVLPNQPVPTGAKVEIAR